MTNKEQGLFLSEIEMIGEQKEFKTVSFEKGTNLFDRVDGALKNLRIAYSFAFVKCCEKYGVPGIDNIYDDLGKLWERAKEIDEEQDVFTKIAKGISFQWRNVIWKTYVDLSKRYAAMLAEGKSLAEL